MKLKTKQVKESILKSIPFSHKKELTGFIDDKGIHYKEGTRLHCPTFPDKDIVFHTHIDVVPSHNIITIPDIPSPSDILVFMLIDNNIMYIKTTRVMITLTKTDKCKRVTHRILRCILENQSYWERLASQGKNEQMFYFLVHYLRRGIDKKNKTWNLSWKRILEQILKVNVMIETSNIKDPL